MYTIINRIEHGAIALITGVAFWYGGFSVWLFIGVIVLMGFFLMGYLGDKHFGDTLYMLSHNYLLAFVIFSYGFIGEMPVLFSVALAVAFRTALDRMVYPDVAKSLVFAFGALRMQRAVVKAPAFTPSFAPQFTQQNIQQPNTEIQPQTKKRTIYSIHDYQAKL